jgi:tubulin-specific chaperone A
MAQERQLSIKAGTVRRLAKELVMYKEEKEREQEKVNKLKNENADPHDVKYAVRLRSRERLSVTDLDDLFPTTVDSSYLCTGKHPSRVYRNDSRYSAEAYYIVKRSFAIHGRWQFCMSNSHRRSQLKLSEAS